MTNIFDELTKLHLDIKEHPFRKSFTDTQNSDFRILGCEYLNLIRQSVDILCDLGYKTEEFAYLKKDLWWAHNFYGGLRTINDTWINKRSYAERRNKMQDKTNFSNLNEAMIWLETYVMYLHEFIESKEMNKAAHIDYECQALPHNGWYYYHATTYAKDENGEWVLTAPIQYVDENYLEHLKNYRTKGEKKDATKYVY